MRPIKGGWHDGMAGKLQVQGRLGGGNMMQQGLAGGVALQADWHRSWMLHEGHQRKLA